MGGVLCDVVDARATAPALFRSLEDTEPRVRMAAAKALGILVGTTRASGKAPVDGQMVLSALIELLGDREVGVRSSALRALAQVGPTASTAPPPALIAALKDPSADNRADAAAAIASFDRGLDPVIPWLLRAIEHEEPRVRSAYLRALDRVEPPAISEALIPALTAALASRDPVTRRSAIHLLVRIGQADGMAIRALTKTLREPIEPSRVNAPSDDPVAEAVYALGKLAPATIWADETIATLTDFLRHVDGARRSAAAGSLGNFGQDAATAVPALIEALRATNSAPVSMGDGQTIAWSLGMISPGTASADETVVALTAALEAKSESTRAAAVTALLRFGPKAAQALPRIRAMQ
jgi:HEAT repeat protein